MSARPKPIEMLFMVGAPSIFGMVKRCHSGIDEVQRAVRRRDVLAGGIAPIREELAEVSTINLRIEVDV
jgi:hypothetical protein